MNSKYPQLWMFPSYIQTPTIELYRAIGLPIVETDPVRFSPSRSGLIKHPTDEAIDIGRNKSLKGRRDQTIDSIANLTDQTHSDVH